jgi:hypothetical protein
VIVCDPEAILPPREPAQGQVIRLSPPQRLCDPLDINLNYSEDENTLARKSDIVLSFCDLIMAASLGWNHEKTVIEALCR